MILRVESEPGIALIRTDFTDAAAWRALEASIEATPEDADEGQCAADYVTLLNDPRYQGLTAADVLDSYPQPRRNRPLHVLLADHRTFTEPGMPLLAVNIGYQHGNVCRINADDLWITELNLDLANLDFNDLQAVPLAEADFL